MPTTSAAPISALMIRFGEVRAATMKLIEPLSPEDLMVQSSPDASPVKWHLAHTSWFFETFVLREFMPGYQAFHPEFHWLFNSYYNSLGEMPEKKLRASFSRPSLESILAYRCHVDNAIALLLEQSPEDQALPRITLGLEHEQQHQELIATDVKHALYTNPLHPPYIEPGSAKSTTEVIAPPISWIAYEGGLTQIGTDPDPAAFDSFAFDNETPRHTVYLAPFSIANRPVTCAEYLAFIDQNGYARPELWLSEGWAKMRSEGWHAPLYWQQDKATESGWSVYTMHGLRPLEQLSETPVCHLSFFEADAYARWAGCRLPTEFEWEHAAASTTIAPEANMLESEALHPTPAVNQPGLQQIFGDTWEWTSSGYTGYPGYKPLPGALGEYNGKFMSSQVILRGGSCVTPGSHIRATYRNFFPPSTRWQFSGVRLAK